MLINNVSWTGALKVTCQCNKPPVALGVNTAALAAWEEKVDFFAGCKLAGVKDGDSTLRVFLPEL